MSFQTPITISEAIENIDSNKYLLPSIQREFEWKHEKIEWLFDSIMRNYPISSFLFWRVEGDTRQSYKFYKFLRTFREEFATHNEEINTDGLNDFTAVLDGQQRLTSLYIGLKGSYAYKKPRVWWEDTEHALPTRHFYLNIQNSLENEEDGRMYEFSFLTKEEYEEEPAKWFKVGKILTLRGIYDFNKYLDENGLKDNEFSYKTLSKLHSVIHTDNIINFFLEKEQDIDKALNIFIRINSGGEPLDFSDLIMSIAVANWQEKDARKEIHKLVDEIRDKGFFISKDFILKVFLLLHSKDIKFKVTNFSTENARDFEQEWERIRKAIHTTFDVIRDFGFVDSNLTSKNALMPIIYYIYHKENNNGFQSRVEFKEDRKIIKKWLNIALIKRIFGGSPDQILSAIRGVFTDDVTKTPISADISAFPIDAIQRRLKGTTKDMTIDDDFIRNILRTQKDSGLAFSILALLYPHLDYKNGDFHKDHLHPHSLFRKMKLKERGIDIEKYDYFLDKDHSNSILNLQLLDANENESKNDKELKEWVIIESKKQNISIEKFCENHLIPNLLELEDFEDFIQQRETLLIEKLKEIIN
ncbi:DUF262 domain-containing protein [Candidatus Peregrinibacteria bacterium]|jgi:uncharacterized protein with ParB-like and HNH nuclease domain|nr:DUF262 domain-containing protein [Candidatus Peregrinibacteria bacterium]MBT4585886.1 DUF262 domain-containing protein [Candidatus Peregrinibacteria bacterium]